MKVEKAYLKSAKFLKSKVKHKDSSVSKNVDSKTGKRKGYGGKSSAELHEAAKKYK